MRSKKWTIDQLRSSAKKATSIRQLLIALNLKPAGGNYLQIKQYLLRHQIDTSHFKGKAWNKGLRGIGNPKVKLHEILVLNSSFQSYKLKQRLFKSSIKKPKCELCGWSKTAIDGRIPVELDHINGDHRDNRLENLRILCPNCHSLQLTHRGKNKRT